MNIYTHILIDTHRHIKYIPIKHTQGCGMNWEVGIDTRTILMLCYAMLSRSVVFDSVGPHRRQPTRLICPWDSPGKNTGVGCHFLLQLGCIYLFKLMFSFSIAIYPVVELLGHIVVLFLVFVRNVHIVSTVAAPIYISINCIQGFPFLHILTNVCIYNIF